jgi:hypothetical protein
MMAVIVDDDNTVPDSGAREAPAHAAELGEGRADRLA